MRREGAWAVSSLSRFAGTLVIGLLAANCDDPNRGPPTRYSYFDAVVEFTAEGQRLKAETTVQCMTPGGLTPGHRPFGPTRSHPFLTKRLPSGAGVMFVVPSCSGGRPPPPDSIPRAYWLDDVLHPTVLEEYLSVTEIGPGKHIEGIHSFQVTEKYGYGETPYPYTDPTLEIPWLESQKPENRHKHKERWIGYFITYAPKKLWSQNKEITALINKLNDQRGIVPFRADQIPEDLRRILDPLAIYQSIYGGLYLPKQQSSNDPSGSPYQIGLRTRTVLLKSEGGGTPGSEYRVSLKSSWPSGKIVFTPANLLPIEQRRQINIEGVTVKGPFRTTYFYDMKTRNLFRIHNYVF